jgi:hypothetical protein
VDLAADICGSLPHMELLASDNYSLQKVFQEICSLHGQCVMASGMDAEPSILRDSAMSCSLDVARRHQLLQGSALRSKSPYFIVLAPTTPKRSRCIESKALCSLAKDIGPWLNAPEILRSHANMADPEA